MTEKDIREAISKTHCYKCRRPYFKFVRLSSLNRPTKNEILVCQNLNCENFLNFKGVGNWERKNKFRNSKRDFEKQNFPNWKPRKKRTDSTR